MYREALRSFTSHVYAWRFGHLYTDLNMRSMESKRIRKYGPLFTKAVSILDKTSLRGTRNIASKTIALT